MSVLWCDCLISHDVLLPRCGALGVHHHSVVQNVTPKDESVFDEKLSSKDIKPSHTLGIFKHDFASDGKIKSTTFLRQFSQDEAARKVTCFCGVSR